jgi:2-polyprenyl-6-methoxyphenol hydroxylase-like FAD-dependent oxidoreductase
MADFLITGAGIGGLATAQALLRLGHRVRVYEAAAELREIGAGVVLGANAMRALDELGLHAAVRPVGTPLTTVRLLDEHGRVLNRADTTSFTERLGYDNLAVHRADLQRELLRALPPGVVQLGHRLARFEQTGAHVTAFFENGEQATAEALVAADGIRSRVRRQLLPASQPRYAGYTCWRAIVHAPGLPTTGSSETWGRAGRFGLVPVANGRLYWFACLNSPEANNPAFGPTGWPICSASLPAFTRPFRRCWRPLPMPTCCGATFSTWPRWLAWPLAGCCCWAMPGTPPRPTWARALVWPSKMPPCWPVVCAVPQPTCPPLLKPSTGIGGPAPAAS